MSRTRTHLRKGYAHPPEKAKPDSVRVYAEWGVAGSWKSSKTHNIYKHCEEEKEEEKEEEEEESNNNNNKKPKRGAEP